MVRKIVRRKVKRSIKGKIIKKILTSPVGHDLMDTKGGGDLSDKVIKLFFRRRSRLGRLIKARKIKSMGIPKGFMLREINNHTPKVGKITITFEKK